MYLLAIETTGAKLSTALITETGDIVELVSEEKLNHLKSLTPMIDEITKTCGIELKHLSAIAVSVGPGSFTGIRIGVSTARALAQALDKKVIPVPTLMSFAYHVPDYRGVICPIFDARRSQVYAGAYMWNDAKIDLSLNDMNDTCGASQNAPFDNFRDNDSERLGDKISQVVKGAAYDLDEYLSMLSQGLQIYGKNEIMLFGDGITPYGERIASWAEQNGYSFYDARTLIASKETGGIPRPMTNIQTAASIARMGLDLYKEGVLLEYGEIEPDYMRKAEAERKLEESCKR